MGATQSKPGQNLSNGTLLLFSHDKFKNPSKLPERKGNSKDVDQIQQTFSKFGFKLEHLDNCTVEEIKETIKFYANVQSSACKNSSCLVVIVLSHGGKRGKLHASDAAYNTHDIWEPFKTSKNFKNKPKIFIFQACRGDREFETIVKPESSVQQTINSVTDSVPLACLNPKVPHQSQFLIAKSTVENRSCVRDQDHGTWYIQCLCDVLELLTTPTELINVLTRVNSAVIARSISTDIGQTPIFTSFFHDDVIIPPIANEPAETRTEASGTQSQNSKSILEPDNYLGSKVKNQFGSLSSKINTLTLSADAENGYVKTQYEWTQSSRGRAIIFHARNYKSQANELNKALKDLQFNKPEMHEIIGENCLKDILDQVSKDPRLEDECCLVVAIIAQIEEESDVSEPYVEKLNIKTDQNSYEISCSWHPFIASKCSAMCDKPKIFLFLDPQLSTDDGGSGQGTFSASSHPEHSTDKQAVTDHVDFLFIHGYGQDFLKGIVQQISKNPWNNKCLLHKVKLAMKLANEGVHKKRISYFQSTLKYELVFHRMEIKQVIINAQSMNYVNSPISTIEEDTEYEENEAVENYRKTMENELKTNFYEDFEVQHEEILKNILLGFRNKTSNMTTTHVDSKIKRIKVGVLKLYKNFFTENAKCQAISIYKKSMDKKCNKPISVASPEDIHEECLAKAKNHFIMKTPHIDTCTKQCYEEILKMDAEKLFLQYKLENTKKIKREFQTGDGRCHSDDNQELVTKIKEKLAISANVELAMRNTDRANYMLPSSKNYQDQPSGIGYKTTISAPHMHAHALKHLSDLLVEGAKVLDVGSGSGYLTVCMAHMVGESGIVVGVDHIPELVDFATKNITRERPEFLSLKRIHFLVGDGRKGVLAYQPYDVIHVGAASEEIPPALLEQLKPGGRMLIPVGPLNGVQKWTRVDKRKNGEIVKRELFGVRFVSLTDKNKQLEK